MTTVDECLDALREAARQLGASPSKAQYEALGLTPASATIVRVCGGWNDAKDLAGLETTPSRGPRVGPKPDDIDVSEPEWAAMSVDQRWHYRNRELNARRTLDRRRRLRDWLGIHKRSLGCANCDEVDSACLDFHHVDGEKDDEITDMMTAGRSAADIHAEIQKCEVLCANCHLAEHISPLSLDAATELRLQREVRRGVPAPDQSPLPKETHLRAWTRLYKERRGCGECGESDGRCLQFHHHDPESKTESIARLISHSRPTAAVIREVRKCVVLCANCHRKVHH
jgi:hypothetical protein